MAGGSGYVEGARVMARLYPRRGSCPTCGGTGHVYIRRDPPHSTSVTVGDNTETCPACQGDGKTAAERAEEARRIAAALELPC